MRAKMKIRTKIFLGFTAIFSLIIILGVLSFFQFSSIKRNAEMLYNHPLVVSNTVRDINIRLTTLYRSVKNVVSLNDSAEIQQNITIIKEEDQKIKALFDILFERYLGDQEDIENAYQAFLNSEEIRSAVVDLKLSGFSLQAAEVAKDKGEAQYGLLLEKLKIISDYASNKADQFHLNSRRTEQQSLKLLIIFIIIFVLVAVILSIIISNNISKPIHKFSKEIRHVLSDSDVAVESQNEEELLETTVEKIKLAYQHIKVSEAKLRSFNEKLEHMVEERTTELLDKSEQLDKNNNELQQEIEERAAIEEELKSTNGMLQDEIFDRTAVEEELRAVNEKLVDEIKQRASIEEELRTANDNLIEEITIRKKTENILTESEFRFRSLSQNLNAIIENKDVSIWSVDKNFQILTINSFFKDYYKTAFGVELEVGNNIIDTIPDTIPGLKEMWVKRYNRAFGGETFKEEDKYQLGNEERYFEVSLNPIHSDGQISGAVVFADDITSEKIAIDSLAASEEKFRKFFQMMPYPLCYVNEEGIIVQFNQSFFEMLEYSPEEIPTLNDWWQLAYPDENYRAWVLETWNKAVEEATINGTPIESIVYKVTSKSGIEKSVVISGITIGNDFLATLMDVTESEKHEKEILSAKEFTDVIVDSLPGIFYMFNSKGKLQRWNKNFAQITGYSNEELKDKLATDFFSGSDVQLIADRVSKVFDKGSAFAEANLITKHGHSIPFYFTGKILTTDSDAFLVGNGTDVSVLKDAELALADSETLLKTLLNATDDTIALIEKDGKILKMNDIGAKRLKQTPDKIIGLNVYDLIQKDVRELRKKRIDRVFETGISEIFEDTRGDMHFENRVFPIFDNDGKVIHAGIFAIDITARRNAEIKQAESETKFRSFFEQGIIGMAISSPTKRWLQANESMLNLFGYTRTEFFSKTWGELTHPDDLKKDEDLFNRLLRHEIEEYSIEKKYLKKDGSIIYANLWVNGIFKHNELDQAFILIDDVSIIKKASAELENALKFNQAVVQESPVGKAVYDESGQCVMANPKVAEILGASTQQVLNQNFTKLETWKKNGLCEAALDVLKKGGTQKMEIKSISSFGKDIWLEYHFTRFYQNDKPHLLFIFNDVSENRMMQEAVRESEYRFELATSAANIGIWDWKLGTSDVFYSTQWKQQVGYDDQELKNDFSTWENLLHPDDDEKMHQNVEKYLKNPEGLFIAEFRMKHKNGTYRWIRNQASGILDKNGQMVRMFGIHSDITEQKLTQLKLRENEEKFRKLFDADPDAIILADANTGIIVDANAAATMLFKKPVNKIIGMHQLELHPKADWESMKEKFQELVDTGNPEAQTIRVIDANQKIIPAEVVATRLTLNDKPIALGLFRDITKRTEAESALKKSEEQHRMIFESVTDAIIICNMKGNIIETNPAASKMYGYTREEFLKLTPANLIHPDYKHELNRFFESTSSGKVFHGEVVDLTKDGVHINSQIIGTNINFRGKTHILAVVRNITEIVKAREELQNSKEQLQLITDTIPVLVSYLDTNMTYKFVNKGYQDWFGLKSDQIIGKHPREIVGENAFQVVRNDLESVLSGRVVRYEKKMPYHIGGTRYTQTTMIPHKSGKKIIGAVICVNDVSRMKEAEIELKKLLSDLERSNKELEQFAYIASHDLQEPLRMVSSFLQLLERKYNPILDDDGREFIHFAVDGASRMKTLINDLLTFSRVGTKGKEFKPINLASVFAVVQRNLTAKIEETGARIIIQPDLPTIDADESQLVQLFQNLIENGIKFRREENPEILLNWSEKDDYFEFSVQDNGIGFDEKFKDKIFTIFQRLHTRDEFPGTGIGLAVCKKIAERHKGTIDVESMVGKGSRFIITIPKNLSEKQQHEA